MKKHPSYSICNTSHECDMLGDNPDEPCWGIVGWTDEICTEDYDDCFWGYLCEGHMPLDSGKPYEAPPND